jgi:phosphoribosylanthranilate isomerase
VARTRVKICGITSVIDAKQSIEAGADAIGLVFYAPSPRAVSIEAAAEICRSIPPFVTVVALLVDAAPEFIKRLLAAVPVDMLQFHGDESASFCEQFQRPYIKAIRMRDGVDLHQACRHYQTARGLLLDAYRPGMPGGTGECFDWQKVPATLPMPIVLAGGLNSDNVAAAIAQVAPFAVDVSGGVEHSKGVKDPVQVNEFIQQVNQAG